MKSKWDKFIERLHNIKKRIAAEREYERNLNRMSEIINKTKLVIDFNHTLNSQVREMLNDVTVIINKAQSENRETLTQEELDEVVEKHMACITLNNECIDRYIALISEAQSLIKPGEEVPQRLKELECELDEIIEENNLNSK
jgi:hypothetical protein